MTDHAVPKGVGFETLREILAGWAAVGAATEPRYTADVADHVGVSDVVGRQSAFFEELGLLEPVGQKHRLTETGAEVAGPLVVDDEEKAAAAFRDVLESWLVTERIQGIVTSNPLSKDELVPLVAAITGQDGDSGRVTTGIGTLLELLTWTDLLSRDDEGRYRVETVHDDGASETEADAVRRPLSEVDIGPERDADRRPVVSVGPDETRVVDGEQALSVHAGPGVEVAVSPGREGRRHVSATSASSHDPATSGGGTAGPDDSTSSDSAGETIEASELTPEGLGAGLDGLDLTDVALQSPPESERAHTLTLSVDADPNDIEALVGAIRRGLSKPE